jgi:hypothetical protein
MLIGNPIPVERAVCISTGNHKDLARCPVSPVNLMNVGTVRTDCHDPIKARRRRDPVLAHPLHSGQVVVYPHALQLCIAVGYPGSEFRVRLGAPAGN